MPCFHFHFRSGGVLTLDRDGENLIDSDAALAQARTIADQIHADRVLAGQTTLGDQLEVHDSAGQLVGVVSLEAANR